MFLFPIAAFMVGVWMIIQGIIAHSLVWFYWGLLASGAGVMIWYLESTR
jgi:hypothetical protein